MRVGRQAGGRVVPAEARGILGRISVLVWLEQKCAWGRRNGWNQIGAGPLITEEGVWTLPQGAHRAMGGFKQGGGR